MSGQHVGYIRVSTAGQNTDRQLEGMELDRVFEEKASGKEKDNRQQLQECIDYLRQGDTLHVHSLDRLGRSLRDLETIVTQLVEKGVKVRFYKEGMEFSQENNGSMGKLFLQILGAFAEFERNLTKERQLEGIEQAKKQGKHLGRHPKLSQEERESIVKEAQEGNKITEISKKYDVSRGTVYNIIKNA